MNLTYKYHHIGIPATGRMKGMTYLPHLKVYATDHESNPFGIQWMVYEEGCPVPDLVRSVPHVAFEVNDLSAAIKGRKVLMAPNSPSPGVRVALVEEAGAPVEFLEFEKAKKKGQQER